MSRATEPNAQRCPICRQPQDAKFRPFCSKRCADLDLAKWLGGGYAIPVVEDEHDRTQPEVGEDGEVG
ncbi:MAG TPA: DNA gyrase inhibitor YacG [Rhizomicrobium sp.]|jgi:hypothetical protein|nr:DNA gyrase inhibitor YacG [Rhizomicrobium sp.]